MSALGLILIILVVIVLAMGMWWAAQILVHLSMPPLRDGGQNGCTTKRELDELAKANWRLAREWDRAGNEAAADAARDRAIDAEKSRDSWLYRTFGW